MLESSVHGTLGFGAIKGIGAGINKTPIAKNVKTRIGQIADQSKLARNFKGAFDIRQDKSMNSNPYTKIKDKYGEQYFDIPWEARTPLEAAQIIVERSSRSILGDADSVNLNATFAKLFYHKYASLREGPNRDISALWEALYNDESLIEAASKARYSKEYFQNLIGATTELKDLSVSEIDAWANGEIS